MVLLDAVLVVVKVGGKRLVDEDGARGAGLLTLGEKGLYVEVNELVVPHREFGRHCRSGGRGRVACSCRRAQSKRGDEGGGRGGETRRPRRLRKVLRGLTGAISRGVSSSPAVRFLPAAPPARSQIPAYPSDSSAAILTPHQLSTTMCMPTDDEALSLYQPEPASSVIGRPDYVPQAPALPPRGCIPSCRRFQVVLRVVGEDAEC